MKNNEIKILDCTLRDGGYVNNWEFSTENTKEILKSLVNARVELIECGFISQTKGKETNSTQFKNISQVNEILSSLDMDLSDTNFCVMINRGEYDLTTLPVFNSKTDLVVGIRYAFHKKVWKEALVEIKTLVEKGYDVYVQPMVTLSYNDSEIIEMIKEVNKIDVFALYIVDSFGAMFGDDFRRLYYLFENNLKEDVYLGYHSHNNLQLAYSNAIDFIQIKELNRQIILDSSIHGMGRGAGNLTTELLVDYLNKKKYTNYNITPLLDTIDKYLSTIYKENYWGYSVAHYMSASFNCHPNYATYLVNTKTLSIVDMQDILSELDQNQRQNFSKATIEELYINFKSKPGHDINIENNIFDGREVLIIASGPNSMNQKSLVDEFIKLKNPIVIAVNHIPQKYSLDYCFFSNQKRFNKFYNNIKKTKTIITTNINCDNSLINYSVVDYQELVRMTNNNNDNVTILLLNLMRKYKIDKVNIAGFDGYNPNGNNYSYEEYDRALDKKVIKINNENIKHSLIEIKEEISLNFITDTFFK